MRKNLSKKSIADERKVMRFPVKSRERKGSLSLPHSIPFIRMISRRTAGKCVFTICSFPKRSKPAVVNVWESLVNKL